MISVLHHRKGRKRIIRDSNFWFYFSYLVFMMDRGWPIYLLFFYGRSIYYSCRVCVRLPVLLLICKHRLLHFSWSTYMCIFISYYTRKPWNRMQIKMYFTEAWYSNSCISATIAKLQLSDLRVINTLGVWEYSINAWFTVVFNEFPSLYFDGRYFGHTYWGSPGRPPSSVWEDLNTTKQQQVFHLWDHVYVDHNVFFLMFYKGRAHFLQWVEGFLHQCEQTYLSNREFARSSVLLFWICGWSHWKVNVYALAWFKNIIHVALINALLYLN